MSERSMDVVTKELANQLLSSKMGIETESYITLLELYELACGSEATTNLDNMVDATDGYYYLPIGNVEYSPVAYGDVGPVEAGGSQIASMSDVLNALDDRMEDEEPVEVDIYDDLA